MLIETPKAIESIEIAKIHLISFDSFFLTSLGLKFLSLYYKSSINSKEAVVLCARDMHSQKIIAFASGSINSNGFHKRLLLSNLQPFALFSLKLIFTKPKSILRLVKNIDKKSIAPFPDENSELLSIAVLPEFQGKGISTALLHAFEQSVKLKGSNCITLTTDYHNNTRAFEFYKKNGYLVYEEFVTYPNRLMYRLYKML